MKQFTPQLWVEKGITKTMQVASVVPVSAFDRLYSFAIPENLSRAIAPGQRVSVPVGRRGRLIDGFVLDISEREWDTTLKFIDSPIDDRSWIDAHLLELGRWIARYYCAPIGRALAAMVPATVRKQSGFRRVRHIWRAQLMEEIEASATRIGPKQRTLLEALPGGGEAVRADEICERIGVSSATLRETIKRGWVAERIEKLARAAPNFDRPIDEPDFTLNDEQQQACTAVAEAIDRREFKVQLLFGVSGSGKTEVYIDAIKRVVAAGRQAIVLVPEIALTTQLVYRFASRLCDVAVIHSGLTGAERSLTWNAIHTGRKRVVIGARSAVFAPCRDLGLIVVDEEQENSYKSQQSPRFHARDVAIKRAQLLNIPVVLGSATPSLETWHNCRVHDHYESIHLTSRVADLEMPKVEVVDMRYEEHARHGAHLLSRLLEKRLGDTLARGEQAVLMLNRRGYAQVLYCPKCKNRVLCHNCKAGMVFHQLTGEAVCHHCFAKIPAPRSCADPCCATRLIPLGLGTERAEAEVRRKFPEARIQRVDSDTMKNVRAYEKVVSDFEARKFDIMIGTQIVAKGLDFPFVSLVGVLSADTALYQPDFRANEGTFQLVTQVAGRAGRARSRGRVVVQTVMGELPALQAATKHDFPAFAERELEIRRETRMPPFTRLTRWVLSDASESILKHAAGEFAETVREACRQLGLPPADAMGPFPCPLERIRRMYRYDILLRTSTATERAKLLDYLRHEKKLHAKVKRMIIDIDPVSLL
ncbi:MAG: primosomal protein N' [Planctomycetota bacterium]|nr:primosomal protein N' [Planctomycetota bacterium]